MGTLPPYADWYPVMALRARGALGHMWIWKSYKNGFRIPNVDYPKNPYRFRQGAHPGMVVTKYYYPENLKTPSQLGQRSLIYDAVYNWKGFADETKRYYNQRVAPKAWDGYRRYLSMYLRANYPMIIYWKDLLRSATESIKLDDYFVNLKDPAFSYVRNGFYTAFESLDAWKVTASSHVLQFPGVHFFSQTTINSVSILYTDSACGFLTEGWSSNYFFETKLTTSNSNSQIIRFGIGDLDPANESYATGFKILNGTLYAQVQSEASEFTSEITGITITNFNTYKIYYNATDAKIYFYVNGILKYTYTGELPGDTPQANSYYYIKTTEAVRKHLYIQYLLRANNITL